MLARLTVLLVLGAHLGLGAPARAAGTPYDVKLGQTTLTFAAAGALLTAALALTDAEPRPWPALDRATLNGADAWVVEMGSEAADVASDVLLAALVLAPFAASAVDVGLASEGFAPDWTSDAAVQLQAFALNSALTYVVKDAVARPRPYAYRDGFDPAAAGVGARRSFYSGHTSTAFTGAVALGMTLGRRHPEARGWIWGLGLSLASTVGALRVAAGKHFVSDVLVGALAGSVVGWLVPTLNLRRRPRGAGASTTAAPLFGLSGGF